MAFTDKIISYEIQGELDGRWETNGIYKTKEEAMNAATAIVGANKFHTVRVTKDISGTESVIFEKACDGPSEKPIKIASIDTAPICKSTTDVFSFEARKTGGRLLRQYLDEVSITFLELATSASHLRSFQRRETFFHQALSRVGTIQSKTKKGPEQVSAPDRVTQLERLFTQNLDTIRDLGDVSEYVEILKSTGGTTLLAMLETSRPAQQDIIFWAATAAYVGAQRDWSEKINLIVNLIKLDSGNEALGRLDSVLAEMLDGSEAIRETIGPHQDLGSSLVTIAKLSIGRLPAEPANNTLPLLGRLNEILRKTRLPLSRTILLDKVAQGIRGIQPLTGQGDEANKAAFITLLGSLVAPSGVIGGSTVCEAITIRARSIFGTDGEDLPADVGIGTIASKITVPATKFIYLFDLGKSEFGAKYKTDIIACLDSLTDKFKASGTSLAGKLNEKQFSTLTNLLRQRFDNNFLDGEDETRIILKIEALLSANPGQTSNAAAAEVSKKPAKTDGSFVMPDSPEAMLAAAQAASKGASPEEAQAAVAKAAAAKNNAQNNPTKKIFPAGEIVFKSGDIQHEAYLIISGEIEIIAEKDDKMTLLAKLTKGDILGEMALIDQSSRMATAKAITDTELSVISEQAFRMRLDRLEKSDRVLRKLLDIYVMRLRSVTNMI